MFFFFRCENSGFTSTQKRKIKKISFTVLDGNGKRNFLSLVVASMFWIYFLLDTVQTLGDVLPATRAEALGKNHEVYWSVHDSPLLAHIQSTLTIKRCFSLPHLSPLTYIYTTCQVIRWGVQYFFTRNKITSVKWKWRLTLFACTHYKAVNLTTGTAELLANTTRNVFFNTSDGG
jgi:hypothetical protein